MNANAASAEPEWLRIARKELGVKEIPGGPNERIAQYRAVVDAPDDSDWCAAFAAWCLTQAGVKGPWTMAARSFLHVGTPLEKWRPGCLAIYWRVSPNDWRGHVGLALSEGLTTISTLGGNQVKAVSIRPYAKDRLLGYRWPS
jgi:uncharacterized protein (TIGR02594 family)